MDEPLTSVTDVGSMDIQLSKKSQPQNRDYTYQYHCHDVIFAILFLGLFIVVLYYGIAGVGELNGLQVFHK